MTKRLTAYVLGAMFLTLGPTGLLKAEDMPGTSSQAPMTSNPTTPAAKSEKKTGHHKAKKAEKKAAKKEAAPADTAAPIKS